MYHALQSCQAESEDYHRVGGGAVHCNPTAHTVISHPAATWLLATGKLRINTATGSLAASSNNWKRKKQLCGTSLHTYELEKLNAAQ